MVVSAKSQSRQVFFADQEEGGSNDNLPGLHPGHEMPELRNAPRQPAAEAVVHYARFAQIGSFPEHAKGPKADAADAPAMDTSAIEKQDAAAKPVKRNVVAACLTSFAFHAIVFTALAVGFVVAPHEAEDEAGEAISVVVLGDSEADQASTGDPDLQVEPQPEEVVAENVKPDTIQPTEAEPVETPAEPVEAQPVQPTQEVTRVSPETVTAAEPEVLTSNSPAETSVVQPMAAQQPEEVAPTEPVETVEALPEPVQPEDAPTPMPKPKAVQPAEKPPVEKKEPPRKVAKKAAGSQGENKQEARRGSADGQENAQSNQNSRTTGGSGADSAAIASYPGKVRSRINRCVQRLPRQYKTEVVSLRLQLSINRGGDVAAASLASGSGNPAVNQAVLALVRGCSVPPLPSDYTKSTWGFTQEVQISSR